ncbi:MAG TPA: ATP-binding protein, partial [Ignisphaera aggregans]|nr:ATP-binding protein [Ignisphaera aggregans]
MLVGIETRRGLKILARVDRIVPVNEFFQEGDPWSELRRRGEDVSIIRVAGRRYTVIEMSLIGAVERGSISDVRFPPEPGDPVVSLGKDNIFEKILNLDRDSEGIVWFGSILGYEDAPLPLIVENITMHIGVFGETGSGKSYTVGYLIELLSSIPTGREGVRVAIPTIVVDANGDYVDFHEVYIAKRRGLGAFNKVYRFVFEKSPVRAKPFTKIIRIDLDEFTARELAEFIVIYRSGGVEVSELQVSALERVLHELGEVYGYTELFTNRVHEIYEALSSLSHREHGFHPQTLRAVRSAVEKFYRDIVENYKLVAREPTIGSDLIDEITSRPSLVILDFSAEGAPGIPLPVKQLVIGYLARLLYRKFTEYKVRGDERYLLFVIEEAQNYAPNPRTYPVTWSLARDYLALIATQGRKFGICLAIVSQRPIFVDPVVLSMLNTWFIHRITPDDATYILKLTGVSQTIERKLVRLPRGVVLIAGQMNAIGVPMLVKVGKRSIPHRIGSTGLIK